MKKILTLLMICCFAITANAYYGGTLKIKDADGRNIVVTVNGKKFMQNGRVLTVRDVPSGNNRIKVYRFRQNNYGMAKADLIYAGMVQVRDNYIYRCTVVEDDEMMIHEYCCTNKSGLFSNQNNNQNNGNDYDAYNDADLNWSDNYWGNVNNGWQKFNDDLDGHLHPHDNYYGNNQNNGNNNNYGNGNNNYGNGNNNNNYGNGNNNYGNGNNNNFGNGNNNIAMSAVNFQSFKQTIQNSKFDSGKETLIKTQLRNMWITAAQLSEIVELVTFESSKLDIAKYGATRVVDKQNLFILYNNFTFESNKTDFANYISTLK